MPDRKPIPDVLANGRWDEHAFPNALASAVVGAITDAHRDLRSNGYRIRYRGTDANGDEQYAIVPASIGPDPR